MALYVYAFRHGGSGAVGLVALLTMLSAALVAPFAAVVADCARREQVVACALLARALLLAAAAVGAAAGLSLFVVCAPAALASTSSRIVFPARVALVPALTRSDQELTAANAVLSTFENAGFISGPALAGAALALASPPVVFTLAGCTTWLGAVLAACVHSEARGESQTAPIHSELVAGFRTIAIDPALRLVVAIYTAETAALGLLMVLVVGLAVDVLHVGDSGTGVLNAALGVGGVAGGSLALVLARRVGGGS